jgi:hypothetical protein
MIRSSSAAECGLPAKIVAAAQPSIAQADAVAAHDQRGIASVDAG